MSNGPGGGAGREVGAGRTIGLIAEVGAPFLEWEHLEEWVRGCRWASRSTIGLDPLLSRRAS